MIPMDSSTGGDLFPLLLALYCVMIGFVTCWPNAPLFGAKVSYEICIRVFPSRRKKEFP